jgi:lipopolysaccharide transport system ATP-binding protein
VSEPAVRIEGLSKRYHIGSTRKTSGDLRETLADVGNRLWGRIAGRPPGSPVAGDEIWALRDVSFEIGEGDVVGVLGRNGSGKSTLLKILSRITEPTEGRATVRGRLSSLLEVGTGFHPDLTGRENVFLNGAIMGMRRSETLRKFDEIVAFAEVEQFIDTPVKHYSSGMYMRLAFAVAAHLESDILVVDEVLAVGDAEFQKKCLGKMKDVSGQGRTVLFVSHNLSAVKMLCNKSLLLSQGRLIEFGETEGALRTYMSTGLAAGSSRAWRSRAEAPRGDRMWLKAARVAQGDVCREQVDIDKPIRLEVDFVNEDEGARLWVTIVLFDAFGVCVLTTASTPRGNLLEERWFCQPHPRGTFRFSVTLPANFLNEGRYFVSMTLASPNPPTEEMAADRIASFEVVDTGFMREPGFVGKWEGVVRLPLEWRGELIEREQGHNQPAENTNQKSA